MSIAESLTLTVGAGTLLGYLWIGIRNRNRISDLDGYLFYARHLPAKGYTRTFVATGISLATVLAFLLDFGGQFGLAVILSPVTYLVGVYVLLRFLPILGEEGYLSRGTTLHSFIGHSFRSESLRLVTAVVSMLGYVGILVIEIHVGVQIFSLFTQNAILLACVAVGIVCFIGIYAWLGGYQAVIDTDRLQLNLILAGTIAAFAVTFYVCASNDSLPSLDRFVPAIWKLPVSFIVVMIVGNIPLQILRMSNWQRIAAVGNLTEVRTGLKRAIVWTFLFWLAFNIIGILLANVKWYPEIQFGNLRLLAVIQESGAFGAYFALPLLFAGMLAALISTADSILVPILTAVIYDFRFHRQLHDGGWAREPSPDEQKALLRSARRTLPIVLLATSGLYVLLVAFAKFDFVSLLFVFFNQQLVLFPAVIIAIDPEKSGLDRLSTPIIVAVLAGWIAVWATTIVGVQTGNQDLVFFAAAIGFGISTSIPLWWKRGREAMLRALKRLFLVPRPG